MIYGIKPNGDLQWYRHDGWQGRHQPLDRRRRGQQRQRRLEQLNASICYCSIRFDKAGNCSVHRGQVPVGSDGAVPVGGLNFKGDRLSIHWSIQLRR